MNENTKIVVLFCITGLLLSVLTFSTPQTSTRYVEEQEPILLIHLDSPFLPNATYALATFTVNLSILWLAPEYLLYEDTDCGEALYTREEPLYREEYRYRIGLAGDWIQTVNFTVQVAKTNALNESWPLYATCFVREDTTGGILYEHSTRLDDTNDTATSHAQLTFMLPEHPVCGGTGPTAEEILFMQILFYGSLIIITVYLLTSCWSKRTTPQEVTP